jgi:hypothetical protein
MKEYAISGACSTYWKGLIGKPEGWRRFGRLGIGGRIILKSMLNK